MKKPEVNNQDKSQVADRAAAFLATVPTNRCRMCNDPKTRDALDALLTVMLARNRRLPSSRISQFLRQETGVGADRTALANHLQAHEPRWQKLSGKTKA